MSDIKGPVHLVGIGGIHMSAIGQLLMERGVTVSGSDLRPSNLTAKLESLGAEDCLRARRRKRPRGHGSCRDHRRCR